MRKIIGQHFSAEDFETSVNMIKENFKLFLQVMKATIIGEKQILKMLHDYFYLIKNYVNIKKLIWFRIKYNADGFEYVVFR